MKGRKTAGRWLTAAGLACGASALLACSLLDWQGLERDAGDAGDGGSTAAVRCGPATTACALPSEECCATNGPGYGDPMASYACVPSDPDAAASACPSKTSVLFPCARAADCAGPADASDIICCVNETSPGGDAWAVSCRQRALCTQAAMQLLCDPSGSDCPSGQSCVQGAYNLSDYFVCK